jgi:hypothetical protein
MNYFLLKNWCNRSTVRRPVARRSSPPIHMATLNGGRPSGDLRCGFNTNEGGMQFLISIAHLQMDGPRHSGRHRRWRTGPSGGAIGTSSVLSVAHDTWHQSQHGLVLRDHGSVGNPFN